MVPLKKSCAHLRISSKIKVSKVGACPPKRPPANGLTGIPQTSPSLSLQNLRGPAPKPGGLFKKERGTLRQAGRTRGGSPAEGIFCPYSTYLSGTAYFLEKTRLKRSRLSRQNMITSHCTPPSGMSSIPEFPRASQRTWDKLHFHADMLYFWIWL